MNVSNLADIVKMTANDWSYFWFNDVGVNIFPRIGKVPIMPYKEYRNKRIPEVLFNHWKKEGKFNTNMCVMVGKLHDHTEILNYARKGLYLNFCDFDNELAIREFCSYKDHQFTLEEMARFVYVVQHSDPTHCHIYWLASSPMAKRTLDKDKKVLEKINNNELPSVEIKGPGDVAFCPGGHHESGNPYLPIGTTEICIIEELGEHIESICKKYHLPVSDSERNKLRSLAKASIISINKSWNSRTKTLDYESEEWSDILESSRNNTLFDRARIYFSKNIKTLSADTFRNLVHSWNQKWCKPPLPPVEVDSICNSILNHNGGQN